MIKVVKGNVVLRVKESEMDFYVNKGYTAKTLDGEIIKESIPTDMASLKKAFLRYRDLAKSLEEKVKSLEADWLCHSLAECVK